MAPKPIRAMIGSKRRWTTRNRYPDRIHRPEVQSRQSQYSCCGRDSRSYWLFRLHRFVIKTEVVNLYQRRCCILETRTVDIRNSNQTKCVVARVNNKINGRTNESNSQPNVLIYWTLRRAPLFQSVFNFQPGFIRSCCLQSMRLFSWFSLKRSTTTISDLGYRS